MDDDVLAGQRLTPVRLPIRVVVPRLPAPDHWDGQAGGSLLRLKGDRLLEAHYLTPSTGRGSALKLAARATQRPSSIVISYRCQPGSPASTSVSRLERTLLETGRVEVYDIYFSFNSDEIRKESEPTLQEIAALLRRHPAWKLAIEGHTDSIASDAYNLELSARRAASVKSALTQRHGADGNRLSTAGAGRDASEGS